MTNNVGSPGGAMYFRNSPQVFVQDVSQVYDSGSYQSHMLVRIGPPHQLSMLITINPRPFVIAVLLLWKYSAAGSLQPK